VDPLTIAAVVGLGIYALASRTSATRSTPTPLQSGDPGAPGGLLGGITFAAYGPNSDPRTWFQGTKPGTVHIGSQQASHFDASGNLRIAQTAAGLTATAAGALGALGIGSAGGIIGASTFGAAGTALGTAVPLIGIGVALAATIISVINAHHQAALAAEGKALNDADPRMLDAMVLVIQGFLGGQIATPMDAQGYLKKVVSDWYGEVKGIQRGTWHYQDADYKANQTYQNSWKRGAPGVEHTQDALKSNWPPDPCNAACVIGHYFTERNALVVMGAIQDAARGNHGLILFPAIPPHDTQGGVPEITVVY
jgi:hypothetical protein